MVTAAIAQQVIAGRWSFDDPAITPTITYDNLSVAIVCVGFEDTTSGDDKRRLDAYARTHDGLTIDVAWSASLIVFQSMVAAVSFANVLHDAFKRRIRIGVNYSETLATPDGVLAAGAHFAKTLMAQSEPGGISISAIVDDKITSTMKAVEFERPEPRQLRHIIFGAIQLSVLLGYFLMWWYGIYWKTSIIAIGGSYTCWPEWLCR